MAQLGRVNDVPGVISGFEAAPKVGLIERSETAESIITARDAQLLLFTCTL